LISDDFSEYEEEILASDEIKQKKVNNFHYEHIG